MEEERRQLLSDCNRYHDEAVSALARVRRLDEALCAERARAEAAEQERDKYRRDAADAAALRRVFMTASEHYGRVREGRTARALAQGKVLSADDHADMEAWRQLYEAVRDTQAGLKILQELEAATRSRQVLEENAR